MEHPWARCDGCGVNLEPWEEGPVIFDCFHALHASCASGSDACPCCGTPRTRPAVAGAPAGASPPDSSVAGAIGSDPSAGVEEEEGPPVIQCEECGGVFRPTDFWGDECPHCILRRGKQWRADPQRAHGSPSSPTWSSWTSFGSPERSPSPSDDVDEFGAQPPAATDIPTGGPSRYSNTVPFGQPPPPAPANPFQPPAQFALPPSTFQQYPDAVPFGQPPPAPANTFEPPAQFAPSPPSVFHQYSHPGPFRPPPYFYRPPPPPPPPPYFYQRPPPPAPAPACSAYAPPAAASPYCAACGGAVVRGQTAVTSQCNHTFHFRCLAGSVYACPACGG